jgi:hypothetical protein
MTTATDGKNRTRPSSPIYRSLMLAIEARRVAMGLSMSTVNDIAGLQDGFFSKMIYPDTPNGRQARWDTVQLAVEALFGKNFVVQIVPGDDENQRLSAAPGIDKGSSTNSLKIRHWRHRKHFEQLGKLGGDARAKLPDYKLTAIGRKGARARWKKARAAQRQGAAHKAANRAPYVVAPKASRPPSTHATGKAANKRQMVLDQAEG